METIIIQAESRKAKALIQFLKVFGVAFKVQQTADENPYDPAFVKKILKRAESARKGNTVEYTEELRKELFGK
jgi:hypothetical protein